VSARAPVKKLRDFTGIFTGFYGKKKYYRLLKCIVANVAKRNYGTVATSLATKHESDLADPVISRETPFFLKKGSRKAP
jgi:hypothetical protein